MTVDRTIHPKPPKWLDAPGLSGVGLAGTSNLIVRLRDSNRALENLREALERDSDDESDLSKRADLPA